MKLTDATMGANWICVSVLVFLVSPFLSADGALLTAGSQYRGKFIGRLTQRKHGVSGEVYAVDARTLHIRHFTYDGLGPDAFFWTGFNPEGPNPNGIIVPDERGTKEVLKGYNGQDITISLPDGLTLRDIKWFGVWCRAYEVNFADIFIPANLDYPQPHVIGSLISSQYGVSTGPIVVVDAQTILVPDFTYDGQAPDLHFWVGRGKPGPDGIRVHDETGGEAPLAKADKKTMVLSLPGDITIFDIDYFGVWCRLYGIDFGHVRVPLNLNVPPSLRMLGVTPQLAVHAAAFPQIKQIAPVQYVQESPQLVLNTLAHQPEYIQHHQPIAQEIPQQQYYHYIETPQKSTVDVHGNANTVYQTVGAQPQVSSYQVQAPLQQEVVYSTPLTSASSAVNPQQLSYQTTLGSNGYSSFTIRTSKGSSTALSLY